MKKFLLITILLSFFVIFKENAYAAALYSNNLITDGWSGWSSFNGCTQGNSFTSCLFGQNPYLNSLYSTARCIQADVNVSNKGNLFYTDFLTTASLDFYVGSNFYFTLGGNQQFDTGVAVPSGTHTLLFCYNNAGDASAYVDGVSIASHTFSSVPSHMSTIGFTVYPNDHISNFFIFDSLPNLNPIPSPFQLPVPLIKQYDLPSGAQVYDTATNWAPNNPFISAWGCALTSTTMVLKYFGINTLPNNTPLTPQTLNDWLKSQPDGYIGNGMLNWLAIPRLTKLVQLAGNNPNFLFHAVQYKRSNFADTTTLLADLNNNQPDILEEPNHFVVATGQAGNTFTINDPYFARFTLNDGYSNTFQTLGRFIGSHTDLSYIMFTGDSSLNFFLKDATGSAVGQQYTQNPLENDQNPGAFSGDPLHIFTLEQPSNQTYNLIVNSSSNTIYSFTGYLYDVNGDVKKMEFNGITGSNGTDSAVVIFNNQNANDVSLQRKITFQIFLDDINQLYKMHHLSKGQYEALLALAKDAQKSSQKHNNLSAKIQLDVALALLNVFKGKGVDAVAYPILQEDIKYLKFSL